MSQEYTITGRLVKEFKPNFQNLPGTLSYELDKLYELGLLKSSRSNENE